MRQYSAWKMTSLRSAIPIGIIVGAAVMAVLPYQALYGQAAAIVQPMTGGGGPGETTGRVSTTEVPKWLMAGGSTFGLIDRDRFFKELRIEKSTVVLDIGSRQGGLYDCHGRGHRARRPYLCARRMGGGACPGEGARFPPGLKERQDRGRRREQGASRSLTRASISA